MEYGKQTQTYTELAAKHMTPTQTNAKEQILIVGMYQQQDAAETTQQAMTGAQEHTQHA